MLDVDELRSFIFRSKDKVWVWIAMNRETREIVASACGDRSENTCRTERAVASCSVKSGMYRRVRCTVEVALNASFNHGKSDPWMFSQLLG